ncbi:MAG: Uma2 family endonuclease [Planctomycetaceae bacterium]
MSTVESPLLTTADLLAMPDDGMDRELIRGRLTERPMTRRNRFHTYAESKLSYLLNNWLVGLAKPCGEVHSGEVGTILRRDPDSTVGIDVAFFSADVMARQTNETTLIDGPPLLAVEILSPSDRMEDIHDKVVEYLDTGVPLVWVVDPVFRTVQVHRPDQQPESFNVNQILSGGDILPGLEISVADIFPKNS